MTAELTGLCVLIVEDEPIIALDLTSIVQEAGAVVLGPATTLAEAEHLSHSEHIAVALLDVRVGKETVTPVAAMLAARRIGLVFHTGHADDEELLTHWPDARVLRKPALPSELVAALLAVAGETQTRSPLPQAFVPPLLRQRPPHAL